MVLMMVIGFKHIMRTRPSVEAEPLWIIPLTHENGVTYYDSYGYSRVPFGVGSITTDGERLFVEDCANSRIRVWNRIGHEADIPIKEGYTCVHMRYNPEYNEIGVIWYDTTLVEPYYEYATIVYPGNSEICEHNQYGEKVWGEYVLDQDGHVVDLTELAQSSERPMEVDTYWNGSNVRAYTIDEIVYLDRFFVGEVEIPQAGGNSILYQCPLACREMKVYLFEEYMEEYEKSMLLPRYTWFSKDGETYIARMKQINDGEMGVFIDGVDWERLILLEEAVIETPYIG